MVEDQGRHRAQDCALRILAARGAVPGLLVREPLLPHWVRLTEQRDRKSQVSGLIQCQAHGRHPVGVGWLPSFLGNIVCGIHTLGRKLGTMNSPHFNIWDTKVFRVLIFCFSFCDSFLLYPKLRNISL